MKITNTLASVTMVIAVSLTPVGNLAMAEAPDSAKVEAMEITSELKLHPLLGAYGLSVVPHDDGSLSIEGMIDDQKAYDALTQFIEDSTEESEMKIENNVVNS